MSYGTIAVILMLIVATPCAFFGVGFGKGVFADRRSLSDRTYQAWVSGIAVALMAWQAVNQMFEILFGLLK